MADDWFDGGSPPQLAANGFGDAPNLLDQDFTATGPDKKWGADISYVWTRESWLYRNPPPKAAFSGSAK